MKITISSGENVESTEIHVRCGQLTPEVEKIVSLLRMFDMQLTGEKDGEMCIIDIAKILYIDTIDKKTFIYTANNVYESKLKLYELEEQLSKTEFFRASKSCIINFKQIISLRADLDRRIRITMSNGEQLLVSRQYAENIKKRLGVK